MRALSVQAPWWWYILHGGRDIENRDWGGSIHGRVLLHAGKWFDEVECDACIADIILRNAGLPAPAQENHLSIDAMKALGGHIVGSVEVVDCVTRSSSPWFFGKYGFVLRNPIAYRTPVPFKGALGFFEVPRLVVADQEPEL